MMGDEEEDKFKRGWVGKVFHSSYSSKQNGVMILINKNLSFVMIKQHHDEDGRIICIEALINGIRTAQCNIYITHRHWPPSAAAQLIHSGKDVNRTQSRRPRRQNLRNILPCCTKLSVANYV